MSKSHLPTCCSRDGEYCLLERSHTRLSARLPGAQVDDWCAKCPCLSHPTATVANHAPGMGHQLDELLKGHVLHSPKVGVLLNPLLAHHTHHLLTACGKKLHAHAHSVQNKYLYHVFQAFQY